MSARPRVGGVLVVTTRNGTFEIRPDDLTEPAVRALLAFHLAQSHATSPLGSPHALGPAGLLNPEITVWTVP